MSAMTSETSLPGRRPASAARATARPRRRRPEQSAPVRLTRRGRVVVVALAALLLFVAFAIGRSSTADAGGGSAVATRDSVVVEPGDTLWTIARRAVPGTDPRQTVERLVEINDLGRRPLRAGERILLP